MATIEKQVQERVPENRIVLRGIPWEVYEVLRDHEENNHVRMTYDRGTLEMMSPSDQHEWVKKLLGRMIESFTEELQVPMRSLSATTWRRHDIDKGLEADECYYIRSHPKISGRKRIDLARDPPPDLALEVVVMHGDVDKMVIYAALGVAEVWQWHDDRLQGFSLRPDGQYAACDFSPNLPMLRISELEQFVDPDLADDESAWIRSFREWVRQRFRAE